MKKYTLVRKFYAWVGFAVVWGAVVSAILTIPAHAAFFGSTVEYRAPEQSLVQPLLVVEGNISHYTASVDETDDSPTITASNKEVEKGFVANNCLPFGTKVVINGELLEVQDRMNRRYGCEHFDVFVETKSEAYEKGRFFSSVSVHRVMPRAQLLEMKPLKFYDRNSK